MEDQEMTGYSVAACEHNQAFANGAEGEFEFVDGLLDLYPNGILSVVSDTFDMFNHTDRISSGRLRDRILARDGIFVTRPDSLGKKDNGDDMTPYETIIHIFTIFERNLRDYIKINEKGYKVLPDQYRVIYGDGLNIKKIEEIENELIANGWCASNIIFGVGGNLLQTINRDTERFAMKASQQKFRMADNTIETRNFSKETPGKESKKGTFHVCEIDGVIQCFNENDPKVEGIPNMLVPYFINGNICKYENLKDIRARVKHYRDQLNV
jgi:nicotinamide phosphoribosyltransferase